MAKCDICRVYNPDSECQAESYLFVNYGIALKVKNVDVFRAKFEKLNGILSIQSIEFLMEIMQTVVVAIVSAAASGSGSRPVAAGSSSRTNVASASRLTACGSTGLKKVWKNTKKKSD